MGDIPPGNGSVQATYTIDEGVPVTKTEPVVLNDYPVNNTVLFTSSVLDPGPHNLSIDVLQTGVNRSYTLWAFWIEPPVDFSLHATSDTAGHTRAKKLQTLEIIVGVFAFVSCIILVVFTVALIRRRKRRRMAVESLKDREGLIKSLLF